MRTRIMQDRIAKRSSRTFLPNSNTHLPRSNKLAQEFNRMELDFFSDHRTAGTRIYRQYSLTQITSTSPATLLAYHSPGRDYCSGPGYKSVMTAGVQKSIMFFNNFILRPRFLFLGAVRVNNFIYI